MWLLRSLQTLVRGGARKITSDARGDIMIDENDSRGNEKIGGEIGAP